MKKLLPIIMLSSAIVVPGLNAEAATLENQGQNPIEYKVSNSDAVVKVYVNGEVKKISTDLNNLEDLKTSKAALQDLLAQLENCEGNSFKLDKGEVKEQPKKAEAPKKEVKKETPKVEKAPVKEAPKAKAPKQSAPTEKPQAPTNTQSKAPAQQAPKAEEKQATQGIGAFEQQVLDLTNAERAKEGLKPLAIDMPLMNSAEQKSADMAKNGYFDHNSPTLGSPFDQMKANGISYRSAGENIAMGQRTPEEVVKGWMNSPGHRANIMNADYTHIGIGYVENGNYWTQQFIQK